jgi:localization factor PodJL
MKSGGPWNLRGLRPEARAAARDAARRSGMSVGEWLNTVIAPNEADDDDGWWASDFDRDSDDRFEPHSRHDDRDRPSERHRSAPPRRRNDRDEPRSRFEDSRYEDRERTPERHRSLPQRQRREREEFADEPRRRSLYAEEQDRDPRRGAPRGRREEDDYRRDEERPRSYRDDAPDYDTPREMHRRRPAPELESRWQRGFRDGDGYEDVRRDVARRRPDREPDDQFRMDFRADDRERRMQDAPRHRRGDRRPSHADVDEALPRPEPAPQRERETRVHQERHGRGSPYRDASEHDREPRLSREHVERNIAQTAAEDRRDAAIDKAVAEIAARQRVLDSSLTDEIAARQRALSGGPEAPAVETPPPQPVQVQSPHVQPPQAQPPQPVEAAPPQVEMPPPAEAPPAAPPQPPRVYEAWTEPPVDLTGLEAQLRDMTARIETLRPSRELELAITGLRTDLTEIGSSLTQALPRRALESLEIEVKALAQRIDHSREAGVDSTALSGIERGLAEVRDALRGLTPAEGLVGFDEAVKGLAKKIDAIVAKEDPAALQQLETAIGALRGIVSHVASNDALAKVAEDVRALSAKVDSLAATSPASPTLSALENRIDILASALSASTEAGHAVPRELEKLLSGLIEKLEWVQLTHTDHAALAHLEDRIATLVQRFDASDARLNHLEAIERGIADLLVHIDQIRAVAGEAPIARMPGVQNSVSAIERDVARTQDSLEAVQGAVEHVVDRLAMIESGIRDQAAQPMAPPPPPPPPPAPPAAALPEAPPKIQEFAEPRPASSAPAVVPIEPVVHRAAPRNPIDPNLPPDHPIEPGSAAGRKPSASAADRIAASEAVANSGKPPVIADPGQKSNFIAAARRAAQAAAAAAPAADVAGKGATGTTKGRRTRPLIIAGAAALIVIGCLQIASRMFESGTAIAPPPPQAQPDKSAPPASAQQPPAAAQPETAPPAQLPVPTAPPAAVPAPQPNPKTGANIPTKPARQMAQQPDTSANDITGTLPHPTAPAAAPLGDKLPANIGGPALRAAALSGDGAAAYEVGMRFAEGRGVPRSNEEAALWLERAAKQGVAPAQFRLGGFYEKGIGVKKDLAAARDLYLAAANKGNGKAMHNLAVLFAEGIDGPADYTNAAHWFREAADHGVMDSQYNLGILYARGVGVAQNFAESYKWFALAAIAGDPDAVKKSDEVASHLDQQSLAAAKLAVKTWTAQAQPDEAVNVKAPAGGWDVTASAAPAKPKPQQPMAIKPPTQSAKIN